MVGGDFNIDLFSKQNSVSSYINEVYSQGCLQTVNYPTHISHTYKNSLIDHNYTNIIKHDVVTECLAFDISDHLSTLTFIKNIHNTKANIKKRMIRETKNFISENFLLELQNKILLINQNQLSDNELWEKFEDTFNLVLNNHAPLRTQTRREYKRNSKPWMTNEIISLIKKRQKLYKIYLKNSSDNNWSNFTSYRNKVTHKIEHTKRNYYNQKIQQTKGNSKKLWQTINDIITIKNNKQPTQLNICNESNNIITDSHQVSNLFNHYFSTIGTELSKKITSPVNYQGNHLTSIKSIKHSIFISPLTVNETLSYISNLDSSKSTKSDSPPIKFIKLSAYIIAPIITKIFNSCISNGIFPNRLKQAEIIPIFKKGNKSNVTNYRPISLLSPFSKIFERHLHSQLNQFLNKHSIIHEYQYGFRENKSTELALTQIVNELSQNTENGYYTCSVFIDLAKAFDTVDHSILLSKLQRYGIRGTPHRLFSDYLNNCKQRTIINNIYSNSEQITCGVLQSSILG